MQRITVTDDEKDLGYAVVHLDLTTQIDLQVPPGWVDSTGLLHDVTNVAIVVLDPARWEARHQSTLEPIGPGWTVLEHAGDSSIQLRAVSPQLVCAGAAPDERPAHPGEVCTCGRTARTVFINERGESGYCGISDGGSGVETWQLPAVVLDTAALQRGYEVLDAEEPLQPARVEAPEGWRHTASLARGDRGEGVTWVVVDPARWQARWAPAGAAETDGWVTATAGAAAVLQVRATQPAEVV